MVQERVKDSLCGIDLPEFLQKNTQLEVRQDLSDLVWVVCALAQSHTLEIVQRVQTQDLVECLDVLLKCVGCVSLKRIQVGQQLVKLEL